MPQSGRRERRVSPSPKALLTIFLLVAEVTDVASFLLAPAGVRLARVAYSKSGDQVHDIDAGVVLTVQRHIDRGLIDDAVNLIRSNPEKLPPSIYNAVIEACSSGGHARREDDPENRLARDLAARRGMRMTNSTGEENKRKTQKHDDNSDAVRIDTAKNKRKTQKHDDDSDADRIDTANELLSEMGTATLHAHEVVITGFSRRGRIRDALSALSRMEGQLDSEHHSNLNPSLSVYQTLLVSLASKQQFSQMNTLLTSMRRRGVRPTVYTFNALLKVCASSKSPRWREAVSLLSQCQREPGVSPDIITYTSTMRALAKGKQARKALDLFRAMKDTGIQLDVFAYTTTMDACAKTNNWKKALQLLEEMRENNVPPNEVTYGVAVNACGNGGQWQTALSLLQTMNDSGMRINSITYNSAIAALSKAARLDAGPDPNVLWEKTQHILGEMHSRGVRQDTFTYSSAISVCGSAGRWEEAVRLIHQMKDSGTNGTKRNKIVAFTSAITACANSKQWDPANQLFQEMKRDGLAPDLVAFNALIGAGMAAGRPDEVYHLWREIGASNLSPDVVTLTEVLYTLDQARGKANRERAESVFKDAVSLGLVLRCDSLDTSSEFDLSRMSPSVARFAVLHIMKNIVKTVGRDSSSHPSDLSFIAGTTRMREHIRTVLRDEVSQSLYCTVPEREQGSLVVKQKVLQNYIARQM
mmetsp:Transcript_2297/g.5387  ORF Transcript_2297/g.5387 Transcript_2297/m.5387 type:complete len:699 (-) Transcript_2297:37-2133(-)